MDRSILFEHGLTIEKNCPVCHATNSNYFVSIVSKDYVLNNQLPEMHLIKCSVCKTLYWNNPSIIGYITPDFDGQSRFTDHYILVGAGIDIGVQLLSTFQDKYSMLEVGCGFGFSLDYWSNFHSKPALGLEAAFYGMVGKKYLKVNIDEKYLSDVEPAIGSFDIVFSSEVIEHVQDPRSFLIALKNNLSPQGVLILTTPSAEFVDEASNISTVFAALSPGFHYFLLSKSSMELLLRSIGFNNIRIDLQHERMIVFASVTENVNREVENDRSNYLEYLYFLSKNDVTIVREGALFRLFKELVNSGAYYEARVVLADLSCIIKIKYNLDIDLLISSPMLNTNFTALDDFLYRIPPYFSILLFYMGILNSLESTQLINKLICFSMSYQIGINIVKAGVQFSQEAESLIDKAGGEYVNALLDNIDYFQFYAKGNNSGLNGEFLNREKIQVLSEKIRVLKERKSKYD